MILGMHHAAIATQNPGTLIQFYCNAFGFEKVFESQWTDKPQNDAMFNLQKSAARVTVLRLGALHLEIFAFSKPPTGPNDFDRPVSEAGFTHIGFEVTEIDAEFARLEEAGVTWHAPPTAGPGVRAAYGRDPEGNVLEILEVLGEHPLKRKSI